MFINFNSNTTGKNFFNILRRDSINYDAIIIGAGISGLFLALELSKYCKVLVIEKKDQPLYKYWLTGENLSIEHKWLLNCVDRKFTTMDFIAFDGTTYRANGSSILWESNKLVNSLIEQLNLKKIKIEFSKKFYSYSLCREKIIAFYGDKSSSAKILVDCTGSDSIVASAENCFQPMGYYVVYGCKVGLKKQIKPVALHNISLNKNIHFFEILPTSNGTAHSLLICPVSSIVDNTNIIQSYNDIVHQTAYSHYIDTCFNDYYGVIPVGSMKRKSLNRIFFWGEAAQVQPPASAMCLHRVIKTYKQVAANIANCIHTDKVSARDLSKCAVNISYFSRIVQKKIFNCFIKINHNGFKKMILNFQKMDQDLLKKCIIGEINLSDILSIRRASDLIRHL